MGFFWHDELRASNTTTRWRVFTRSPQPLARACIQIEQYENRDALGLLRPAFHNLDTDLARSQHLIQARPLQRRMNIVLTRRQIRRRQTEFR